MALIMVEISSDEKKTKTTHTSNWRCVFNIRWEDTGDDEEVHEAPSSDSSDLLCNIKNDND